MVNRRFLFVLFVPIACIFAMVLVYINGQGSRADNSQPSSKQVYLNSSMPDRSKAQKLYGKIKPPADIYIDLAGTENPDGPINIIVSASSLIPVSSGTITLKIPQIGAEPNHTDVLWSGAPMDFIAETIEYTLDTLPVGKYHLIAIFEFTPNNENVEKLALSKSLYLDVKPDVILSSNVSFDHIKRVELWKELEERALMSLSPKLQATDRKTVSRKLAELEARDPDIIARKIAEIRATDPDVARRILELNRLKVETTEDSNLINKELPVTEGESVRTSSAILRDQPAFEKAVPIRQKSGKE